MYVRTEKDGDTTIAVADTMTELAEILGISVSAISHSMKRGSNIYHYVPDDEDEGGDEE